MSAARARVREYSPKYLRSLIAELCGFCVDDRLPIGTASAYTAAAIYDRIAH
jgi:hypothetical protein